MAELNCLGRDTLDVQPEADPVSAHARVYRGCARPQRIACFLEISDGSESGKIPAVGSRCLLTSVSGPAVFKLAIFNPPSPSPLSFCDPSHLLNVAFLSVDLFLNHRSLFSASVTLKKLLTLLSDSILSLVLADLCLIELERN